MDVGGVSESTVGDLDSGNQSNGGALCKSIEHNNDHNSDDAKLLLCDGNNSGPLNCSNTQQPIVDKNSEEFPSSAPATSPSPNANPGSTKGYGLKKWRRIRRNDHVFAAVKDIESELEKEKEKDYDFDSTGRILKRGSDNLNQNLTSSKEIEEGGSMIPRSTNTSITNTNNNNNTSNAFAQDNIATTFSADADSEDSNSHRSSSKSSTAASAPKSTLRPSAPSHYPLPHDRHMIKNSNNRLSLSKSPSPSPSPSDPDKKPRGVELDKDRDNSPRSSLESDSRSSNPVFLRANSPLPFDSHSLPFPPPHSSIAATATASATNHHPLPDLVDSIFMLQSAQLALQAEVQKFAEIGKGISSLCDDLDKTSGVPVSSSDGLSECNHAYCRNIAQRLERQLNEAEDRLKEKELRIAELETTRIFLGSPQDHAGIPVVQQYKRFIEMEAELQDLFKQKVEAEVQSVVLTRSTKVSRVLLEESLDLTRSTKVSRVLLEESLDLMRQQKSESREQVPSPRLVVDVENKVVTRQEQAEKWDRHDASTIDSEEILTMKRGVMKFTKYLFIQLALLIYVFALFVVQLGPKSAVVVPT